MKIISNQQSIRGIRGCRMVGYALLHTPYHKLVVGNDKGYVIPAPYQVRGKLRLESGGMGVAVVGNSKNKFVPAMPGQEK